VELGGHLDGFASGRRGADHLDVCLETEQLRQVIAGLRDVINDEDTDLIGHLALVGSLWCAGMKDDGLPL
jgi:hypothetical protein